MNSFINVFKEGQILNSELVAQSSVHEILHTLRLEHPFELTQSADTKLFKTGINQFLTSPLTDSNIVNNIMSYPMIEINGKRGQDLTHLTKGQFQFLLQEIRRQNQGYGFIGKGKSYEDYIDYWLNWPGVPVR